MTSGKNKKPKQSKDNLTVDYDPEDFHSSLPALARELKTSKPTSSVGIDALIHEETLEDTVGVFSGDFSSKKKSNIQYSDGNVKDPDIYDYLKRCKDDKAGVCQAFEIIGYMESRNEITSEKAVELRKKIQKDGIRSLGPYKPWGHYERGSRFKQ
jgi:hypothetical protein